MYELGSADNSNMNHFMSKVHVGHNTSILYYFLELSMSSWLSMSVCPCLCSIASQIWL